MYLFSRLWKLTHTYGHNRPLIWKIMNIFWKNTCFIYIWQSEDFNIKKFSAETWLPFEIFGNCERTRRFLWNYCRRNEPFLTEYLTRKSVLLKGSHSIRLVVNPITMVHRPGDWLRSTILHNKHFYWIQPIHRTTL